MHTGVPPCQAALTFVGASIACPALVGPAIQAGGTGYALRMTRVQGEACKPPRPEAESAVIREPGSGGAIRAQGADAIGLVLSDRPLKPAERSPLFQEMEVARIPLAFTGTRAYPVLTPGKVAAIYAGDKWLDRR